MENQNSIGQETKKGFNLHGKKKKVIIICIAALLLFSFAARGVGLRSAFSWGWGNRGWNVGGYGLMNTGNTAIAVKDFEPMEVVFAESIANRRDGYGITYNALMKEAVAKGADAIINVSIAPTSGFFNRTWSGSALAIKYKD